MAEQAPIETRIVDAIEAAIEALADFTSDRVYRGAYMPKAGTPKPIVNIVPRSNKGEDEDGNTTHRDMFIQLLVIVRIDESQAKDQFTQLHDLYNKVHLVMEDLANSKMNRMPGFEQLIEHEPAEWDGFEDKDTYAFVTSLWKAVYTRERGTPA